MWTRYHLAGILTLALLVRLSLIPFQHLIQDRIEISTPISSFNRCSFMFFFFLIQFFFFFFFVFVLSFSLFPFNFLVREGFFLWTHDKSPYAGSAYHQPPLLLSLFSLGASLSHAQLCLLFVFLDLVNLLLVSSINRQLYGSSASPLPALIYALNPFCVVSALGLATTTLANLLLLAAFSLHLSKSPIVSVFFAPIALGIAVYFNYALLILAIPLSLLTKAPAISRLSSHGLTLLTVVGLYFASFLLMDASWAWAWDTVGYEILLQELTPNMGPLWYLFTELFTEFTPLFQFAVQGYILIL